MTRETTAQLWRNLRKRSTLEQNPGIPSSKWKGRSLREASVQRTLKIVSYVLAFAYFLVDALFVSVARPISRWLAHHLRLERLRTWIRSLSPYPSLALFSIPVIVLEPVKPIAAYLAATG